MPLPYPNIPAAGDFLSVSQAQIQGNFVALNNVVDGVFDQVGAAPATAATQLALVNLNVGGVPQLHLTRQSSGATIPITRYTAGANQGFYYLPSGLLVKYGRRILSAATSPVLEPFITPPVFTHVWAHFVTIATGGSLGVNVAPYVYVDTNNSSLVAIRLFGGVSANPAQQIVASYMVIGDTL